VASRRDDDSLKIAWLCLRVASRRDDEFEYCNQGQLKIKNW